MNLINLNRDIIKEVRFGKIVGLAGEIFKRPKFEIESPFSSYFFCIYHIISSPPIESLKREREIVADFSISERPSGRMNLYINIGEFAKKAIEFGFEYERRGLNDPAELFYLERIFKRRPFELRYTEKKADKK